jgi:hypothetical protein
MVNWYVARIRGVIEMATPVLTFDLGTAMAGERRRDAEKNRLARRAMTPAKPGILEQVIQAFGTVLIRLGRTLHGSAGEPEMSHAS